MNTRSLLRRRACAAAATLVAVVPALAVVGTTAAGAVDVTQVNVGPNENCATAGLHGDAGYTSTCWDMSLQSEVLVDGADVADSTWVAPGSTVTVRLTVVTEGGQASFYEENNDGLKRNEVGGHSDIRALVSIGLPSQTGTQLAAPTNVRMSRTDGGDRGNGPGTVCSTQALDEPAVSDGLTAMTLGAAAVGGTQMSAQVTSGTLTATWDDMAWDRCRGALSQNGIYAGHVIEFEQVVSGYGASVAALKWNFGKFVLARDNMSRTLSWGADSVRTLKVDADADGDGVPAQTDPSDADACVPSADAGTCDRDGDGVPNSSDPAPTDPCSPSNTVGACDRDGDGEPNKTDTDPTDPCENSHGITAYPGCDDDGDGVPSPKVPGSNGIGPTGRTDPAPLNPCVPSITVAACRNTGLGFHAVTPKRVMDSRNGNGTTATPFGNGETRSVQIAGRAGVPTNAVSVVLNVTATRSTGATRIGVWPTGGTQPSLADVRVPAGQSRPAMTIVPLGVDGKVQVANALGSSDVVLDVFGYFTPTGDGLNPAPPVRVFDTRHAIGTVRRPMAADETRTLALAGHNGVPLNATAAIVNITVTKGTTTSWLTAGPSGQSRPFVSNVNWVANETSPNMSIVPIGTDGSIDLYNFAGSADVIVDLAGWVGPSATQFLRSTTQRTVFDTTTGIGTSRSAFTSDSSRSSAVMSTAGYPSEATAVIGSVQALSATGSTYLTVWPGTANQPYTSWMNTVKDDPRANGIVAVTDSGVLSVYNFRNSTNVAISASGWLAPKAAP